jgi:predicted N-formylglutamate amidohydrolase
MNGFARLLGEDEPLPVDVVNRQGASAFLLTADHAGRRIPRSLGDFGVSPADMERHIAWDIGIDPVTRMLSARLDAPAVLQRYSRLVIDCNRNPQVESAFPVVSEATAVPGNVGIDEAEKRRRVEGLFLPYHGEISGLIEARLPGPLIYVAMHSFTPVFHGQARPMHVAVLYNRSARFSRAVADLLREDTGLVVAENEPYRVSDETDYGVPVHAERRGLDYVEIEIRQDLIESEAGQREWAARLGDILPAAAARLGVKGAVA